MLLNGRAMDIWVKALGSEHPTVAHALNSQALLLIAQVRPARISWIIHVNNEAFDLDKYPYDKCIVAQSL